MQQLTTTQVALLSAAFTLIGRSLRRPYIAGMYSSAPSEAGIVHDYYKKVIDRRITAYETLEILVVNLKTAVVDTRRPQALSLPLCKIQLARDPPADVQHHVANIVAERRRGDFPR